MRALFLSLLATVAVAQDGDSGFTVSVSPYTTPYLPLSAEAQAVAEAGAFGHAEDPLRMLDNPALLADFDDGVRVSGHLMSAWLGSEDLEATGGAIAGGFRTRIGGLPASVGVGLATGAFSQPPYVVTDVQGQELGVSPDGDERVVALGVGVGLSGPVRVRIGGAVQSLRSQPLTRYTGPFYGGSSSLGLDASERAHAVTADLGLDVTAPVGRWLQPEPSAAGVRGVLDVTLGYAVRGIAISGEAPPGFVATPGRQPMAGLSLRAGLDVEAQSATPLRAVEAEFLTGAEDPGAAAFGLSASNVLLGADPSDQALVRRAVRLTLVEAVSLSRGVLEGASFVERASWGVGLSSAGALRLAGLLADRPDLHGLGGRFDLRYTYAEYTFDPGDSPYATTPAHGVVLRVRP